MIENPVIENKAAALDAEAEQIAAQEQPPEAVEQPAHAPSDSRSAPVVTTYEELRGLIDVSVKVLSPIWPGLPDIYTPDACDKLAQSGAALLDKYDWSVSDLFKRFKEEINFGFVALPLVYQTVLAMRAGRLRLKTKPTGETGETDERALGSNVAPIFGPVPDSTAPGG